MNKHTDFQPSARMMAALNRQMREKGLDAGLSDHLAQFAGSVAQIEMVTDGLTSFYRERLPLLGNETDFEAIIQMAAPKMAGASDKEGIFQALTDASIDWKALTAEDGGDILNIAPSASANQPIGEIHGDDDFSYLNPRVRAQVDGFLARVRPSHKPDNHSRQFASMSLLDHAKYALSQNGKQPFMAGSMRTVEMALHTTSDFPLFLQAAGSRMLQDGYEAAQSGLKMVSREMTAPDFRAMSGLQLGAAPDLTEVAEGAEFTRGTINETGETIQLATFGKIFGLSRQAIVNDDLNAFEQVFPQMGEAVARLEGQKFADLLNENSGAGPLMSDGNAMFYADHKNLADIGAAISIATLGAGRTAMRRQTGLAGEKINVVPAFLVVPPDLETVAEQVVSEVQATSVNDTNPFAGRLQVVVDAYLDNATQWYLASIPGRPAGLAHAYLDGQSVPSLFTNEGFEVDGIQYKIRHDFAASFMGWRGWYANPGQ